jgi:hypothetical protein
MQPNNFLDALLLDSEPSTERMSVENPEEKDTENLYDTNPREQIFFEEPS